MNVQLMMTVLSLLGDLPMPLQTHVQPATLTAIYAEWTSTGSVTVPCPDPNSAINPMGQMAVVSQTAPQKDGSTIGVAMPVLLLPESTMCERKVKNLHHSIFPSVMDAGEFRLHCPDGQCQEWHARAATDEEVVDYALSKRGWQITHYPGGDAFAYPQGVFEVYPRGERDFEHPLAQGSSALEAISKALGGN